MPAVYRLEVVECEHCGEKMNVAPHRQPVVHVEREANGQRSFPSSTPTTGCSTSASLELPTESELSKWRLRALIVDASSSGTS
jgi:hypothetical protein